MIVTFETRGHPRITMLGHVAKDLLSRIAFDATQDGAMRPEALAQLREQLARSVEETSAPATRSEGADAGAQEEDQEEDQEPAVSLKHRALPLLSLMEAAERARDYVTWTVKG